MKTYHFPTTFTDNRHVTCVVEQLMPVPLATPTRLPVVKGRSRSSRPGRRRRFGRAAAEASATAPVVGAKSPPVASAGARPRRRQRRRTEAAAADGL